MLSIEHLLNETVFVAFTLCHSERCHSGAYDDSYSRVLVTGDRRERKFQLVFLQYSCRHSHRERSDDNSQ